MMKNNWKYLGWDGYYPIDDFPKRMPRTATYILGVEWSWSPMHSRVESYYISTNRSRSHWFFWHSYIDDNDWSYPRINTITAMGTYKGVNKKEAAIKLLEIYWKNEANEYDLDKGFMYSSYGLLSDEEAQPIADKTLKDC